MRMSSSLALSLLTFVACSSSDPVDTASATNASAEATDATADGDSTAADDDGVTETSADAASAETASTDSADTVSTDTANPDTTGAATTGSGATRVQFETTLGNIVFELDETAAPITSANFLAYVDAGFFDGSDGQGATIFHRVVPGFVIQGGGLTEALDTKATMPAIVNESGNGLTNVRGAISMARTTDPNSATSQFFVNLVDNASLDMAPGYAVFGAVVEGMDVVDAIAAVETTTVGQYEGVPVEPIVVTAATRL